MLKNPRHERFAQAYARFGNAAAAWREAGGKGKNADVHGPAWMGKDGIAQRITEIRAMMEQKFEMDRETWLTRLLENADKCRNAGALACERQALREIGQAMPGWYAEGRQEIRVKSSPSTAAADLMCSPAALDALANMIPPEKRTAFIVRLNSGKQPTLA